VERLGSGTGAVLYLFDGSNVLHEGGFASRDELVDRLAGFVALEGARGYVVFDGVGEDSVVGPVEVRFAEHADDLIERLAAEHRAREAVTVVSSDRAIRTTAGQETRRVSAKTFMRDLQETRPTPPPQARSKVEDSLDEETRRRLEEWRRGY
jgi:predicted RNA-binding protein with PIN domain